MRNGGIAFLLSLAFHALIAAGLALCLEHASSPDELARLDLTSVDLSFAETPDETAAVAPASMPAPEIPPPKPPESEPPPPTEEAARTLPCAPRPDTTDLPRPKVPHEQLETPPAPPAASPAPAAPPVAPRQARVDALPKPRRTIRPDYPRESRQRGEQGEVSLELDVDEHGAVGDVRVIRSSGYPLLDEAAVRAARAARFTPAKSAGRSVSSAARLTLEFRLK